MKNSTPILNAVFDRYLPHLNNAETKVLLIVFRQTSGWNDPTSVTGRKQRDWISHNQFEAKTGCSRRAIVYAVQSLIDLRLIEVIDRSGSLLDTSEKRMRKQRLYYRPASASILSDNLVDILMRKIKSRAKNTSDLCNKFTALVQQMHYTKE